MSARETRRKRLIVHHPGFPLPDRIIRGQANRNDDQKGWTGGTRRGYGHCALSEPFVIPTPDRPLQGWAAAGIQTIRIEGRRETSEKVGRADRGEVTGGESGSARAKPSSAGNRFGPGRFSKAG